MSKVKKFFRLAAYYLFSMLFIVSCVTEKQRQKICNSCSVKDSTVLKETIKIKDTTIYVSRKGETVFLQSPCDSIGNLFFTPKVVKNDGVKTNISHIGNVLTVRCDVDSLKRIIQLQQKQITNYTKSNSVKYIPCKNERTSLDGFCRWFSLICIIIIVCYFIIKFIKSYFKIF